jgi:hypothetical protein
MSHSFYYVHSKGLLIGILSEFYYYVQAEACNVRGEVFSALSDVRSIGFLDVKGCLKFFNGVFRGVFAWEKSMLSALRFLIVVSPDCRRYLFGVVDGGVFLD